MFFAHLQWILLCWTPVGMFLLFALSFSTDQTESQTYHMETVGTQVGHMHPVNREKKAEGDDFHYKKV